MALMHTVRCGLAKKFVPENMYKMGMLSVRYSHGEGEHEHHGDPPVFRIERNPYREEIGFGVCGEKAYFDFVDFPVPSVRYKQDTPEVLALREKEKGDWKKLSIAEKKEIYRASFRLTFAEIEAPNGRWKSYFGWFCFFYATGLWFFLLIYKLKNSGRMRPSLTLEARQAQYQRLIALRVNPITGLGSKWDYEKNDWKK